jgi:hypothetical protein
MNAMRVFSAWLAMLALVGCGSKSDGGAAPSNADPPSSPASPVELAVPVPASGGAANDNVPERPAPLLWVVDGPKGNTYLHGTMHLGIDIHRDVHPMVFDTLDGCTKFVMEVDISKVDPVAMMQMAQLPDDERLDQLLTRDQWNELTNRVALFPEDKLAKFQPWFVIVAITQSLLPSTQPMDGELHARAVERDMKVEFLEDWKYQIEVLGEATSVDDIVDMIDNFEDTKKDVRDLAAAYRDGNTDGISKILFDPEKYKKNPKMIDLLITRRNQEWIPPLEKYIAEGNVFVAVGVGHLIGDHGVIAMLRENGHAVERVKLSAPVPERLPIPASGAR